MVRTDGDLQGGTETEITGRLVRCPGCDRATGVPVPHGSAIVGTGGAGESAGPAGETGEVGAADEIDETAGADGTTPTRCPGCETRFEVRYALGGSE